MKAEHIEDAGWYWYREDGDFWNMAQVRTLGQDPERWECWEYTAVGADAIRCGYLAGFTGDFVPITPPTDALPEADEVVAEWNKTKGVTKCRALNKTRRSSLRARLKDPEWDWRAALAKFPLPCTIGGTWKPGFDFFIRSGSVNAIIEGKYDFTKNERAAARQGMDAAEGATGTTF